MKCLNMKVADILFFLVNFITICSSDFPQDKTSQTTSLRPEETFETKLSRDCPKVLEIVRENNLTDYAINCKQLTSAEVNVENVLQYSCFFVRDMLKFICDNKLNMTTNLLKQDNLDFCPFNFSYLEEAGFKINSSELIKEFTKKDDCSLICRDLKKPKTECVVLNYFFRTINQSITQKEIILPEVEKPQIKVDNTQVTAQKTESTLVNTKSDQDVKQLEKIHTEEAKAATTFNKPSEIRESNTKEVKTENKTEKFEPTASTPKKEQTSETEPKVLENENSAPENNEGINNDDDDVDLGEPNGLKTELAFAPDNPNMESIEEKKIVPSVRQKDIYSADGFFQAEDSHFFFYFIMVSSVIVIGYLAFHNKNKILAYALEGTSSRRCRRRPNPARYRKLETNLEEVISSSSTNMAASSVVY